jgi:AraC family transcriptional regulator of arabinose operon
MPSKVFRDIWLSIPYFREGEAVSNARYRWNCYDRGEEPFVLFQWTHSGEGAFEGRHGRLAVPADHAFVAVVPERSTYFYPPEQKETWVFTWLNFYGSLACDLFRKLQAEFGPVIPLSSRGAAAASLRRLLTMIALAEHADRSQISLQAYAFVLEWWREASQPTGGPENGLARALRFCQERFREPLGVKQMAHEAGMSREHFSRSFLERTGETPAALLRRLRISEAAALLRETSLPVQEIAMRSGFYSARHLMRTFQRVHRANPSEFRQRK